MNKNYLGPAPRDAGVDAAPPPPPPDASNVLDTGVFDATLSFCSKAPPNLWCDDFDEKFSAQWDNVIVTNA